MPSSSENMQRVVTRFPCVIPPDARRNSAAPEKPAAQEKCAVQEKRPLLHLSLLFRCMLIALLLLSLNVMLVLSENPLLISLYTRVTTLIH
ncbi:MAG TPA: hypothetical protein VET88_09965 [Gammaproteobacteria bacterium]|nr:hypothetical protein [Gammaproteobacteria bacterium]